MPPLRALLVVLAKPNDKRFHVREKIAQDLKELIPVFAKEKTGMDVSVDSVALIWGRHDSHKRVLKILKNWWPGYNQYLVIGHWTVGRNWLGVYEGQICYGYGYIHTYWTFMNKGVFHGLSHEILHWLLHKKGMPSSVWVNRVHQFDQKGDKDWWSKYISPMIEGIDFWRRIGKSRGAKYITLGGSYEQ